MTEANRAFRLEPSPDHPGWQCFTPPDPAGFNAQVLGPILVRTEGAGSARVRIVPRAHFANVVGAIHGGALLGLVDMSLFAALRILTGREPSAAVTLDLTNQFLAPGRMDRPVDAVVDVLRETGRLVFLRGLVEQDDAAVCAFQATVRKLDSGR